MQVQPFDLLGITIKSLAEIEKEVSEPPSAGEGPSRHSLTPGSLLSGGVHPTGRKDPGVGHHFERSTSVSLTFTAWRKKLTFNVVIQVKGDQHLLVLSKSEGFKGQMGQSLVLYFLKCVSLKKVGDGRGVDFSATFCCRTRHQ